MAISTQASIICSADADLRTSTGVLGDRARNVIDTMNAGSTGVQTSNASSYFCSTIARLAQRKNFYALTLCMEAGEAVAAFIRSQNVQVLTDLVASPNTAGDTQDRNRPLHGLLAALYSYDGDVADITEAIANIQHVPRDAAASRRALCDALNVASTTYEALRRVPM
jgi:hypothetical protein